MRMMKDKLIKINICLFIFIYMITSIVTFSYSAEDENQESQEGMQIYSEAAILMEASTGKVLYEKNMNERKYPASTTKILTAIIALEKCDLDEVATASNNAVMTVKSGYTKADIQVGEKFSIEELLNVMMVQSANEAATIIAEHISGNVSEFSKLMNEKAREIGCKNSNFVNANGVHDENHYSTAYDMALIARYCMKNEVFRNLAKMMECSLPRTEFWQDEQVEEHGERNFKNTNKLLIEGNRYYYPYAIGVKTGFTTPAKNCLISASNKNGFETIAVVLHAETTEDGLSARYLDTINLFEYGYNNYNLEDIQKEYPGVVTERTKMETNISSRNKSSSVVDKSSEFLNSEFTSETDESNNGSITLILIGIVLIIFAIILVIRGENKKTRKKGKHGYNSNLYKFNLN